MMNHTNPPPQKGHLFLFEKDFLMENRQKKKEMEKCTEGGFGLAASS